MKTFVKYPVFLMCIILAANSVYADIASNTLNENAESVNKLDKEDLYLAADKLKIIENKEINIRVYYECHCPGSREFVSIDFKKIVEKLNQYLDIKTYPYGHAKTIVHDGKLEFECQHGPRECYGNKLHACALDIIKNHTAALLFDSCMMSSSQEGLGSDDTAADKCGSSMNINSSAIKECAKGEKGSDLLKYYGEESEKANFLYVPYILINGKEYERSDDTMEDVCAMFSNPPPPCTEFNIF